MTFITALQVDAIRFYFLLGTEPEALRLSHSSRKELVLDSAILSSFLVPGALYEGFRA